MSKSAWKMRGGDTLPASTFLSSLNHSPKGVGVKDETQKSKVRF